MTAEIIYHAAATGPHVRDDKVMNMPAGRPSKYNPSMCAIVIAAGEEGETLAGMAEACDVDRETINNWMVAHPEFSRAIKRGLQRAQVWWERKGKEGTFGGVDGFNATSYIFQMKNRFRSDWNDTVKNEHTGADGGAIVQKIERIIVDPRDDN